MKISEKAITKQDASFKTEPLFFKNIRENLYQFTKHPKHVLSKIKNKNNKFKQW